MAGLVVGGVVLGAQLIVEDRRIAFEHQREDTAQAAATRLENLRFVRTLSSAGRLDRSFGALDLAGIELGGSNLAYADFRGADLSGANLAGTNLEGPNLSLAKLTNANLFAADLTGAGMVDTIVEDADFVFADLSGAFVPNTDLADPERNLGVAVWDSATFIGAYVAGIDFSATTSLVSGWVLGARFVDVDLSVVTIRPLPGTETETILYSPPNVRPEASKDDCNRLQKHING